MHSEVTAEDQLQEGAGAKLTAGDVLRQERLRRGLSEKVVADKLHITMHYVRALEANAYEKLPSAVFTKGYIKNYALLLQLEVDDLFSLYEEYNAQLQEGMAEASRQRARSKTDRNKPWVIFSLIAFLGGFAGLWLYNNLSKDDPVSEPAELEINAVTPAVNQRQPTETAANQFSLEQAPTEVVEQAPVGGTALVELAEDEFLAEATDTDVQISESPVAADLDEQADTVSALTNLAANDRAGLLAVESEILAVTQSQASVSADDAGNVPQIIEVAAVGSDVLRITFSGESWIEVSDSASNQIYRDLREDGDVLEITGSAPFSILLGDAPFASMVLNDTEIDISSNIRIDNSARLTVGL